MDLLLCMQPELALPVCKSARDIYTLSRSGLAVLYDSRDLGHAIRFDMSEETIRIVIIVYSAADDADASGKVLVCFGKLGGEGSL